MDRFEKRNLMGKKARFDSYLIRKVGKSSKKRVWVRETLDKPIDGWIVGFRTVYNGTIKTDWLDSDYLIRGTGTYHYFKSEKGIHHVLITTSPYKKPYRVPLENFYILPKLVNLKEKFGEIFDED